MPGTPEIAKGKSPRVRIQALKRRVKNGTQQALRHARLTEVYANSVQEDIAEIARLEAEIDRT